MRIRFLLFSTLIYFILAGAAFPYLKGYADNPDTISYISIAQKYQAGDLNNAVNGYWSPLISWLLAPALALGKDPVIAFKILQVLIGLFALINWNVLVFRTITLPWLRAIVITMAVPFLVSWACLQPTADLLFLTACLFYLNMVSDRDFFNLRNYGIIAGVLGAFLYYAKAFGAVFFLAHFSILFLKNFRSTREYLYRRHLLRNYLYALACFVFIAGWWVLMISNRYGHFTISETALFNNSREVAGAPGQVVELPVLGEGLYAPGRSAINAWENPGAAVTVHALQPLHSADDFQKYENLVWRNLLSIYYYDFQRQAGTVFIVLFLFFLFTRRRKKLASNDYIFSSLLVILLFYAGYTFILVHPRYIWLCTLLMLLATAFMTEHVFLTHEKKSWRVAGVAFLSITFLLSAKRPLKEIVFSEDKDLSGHQIGIAVLHPFRLMERVYQTDKLFSVVLADLGNKIPMNSNIASLKSKDAPRDPYTHASRISLKSGSRYYGQVNADEHADSLFRLNGISYVVAFSKSDNPLDTSANWQIIHNEPGFPLKVYKASPVISSLLPSP